MLVWKIAFRNLFRQKSRSLLCGSSICGAFILFSISLGFSDGTYGTIIRMLTENHSGHVQIHRKGFLDNPSINCHFRLNEELEQSLREYEEVESWTARIHSAALIFGERKSGFARVTGLDPEHEEQVTSLSRKLESGKLFRNSTTQEILLGAKLRNLLQVEVGEEVVLLGQGADGSIANDIFTVAGILKADAEMRDGNRAYLPLKTAQKYFSLGNRVHEIALHLREDGYAREQSVLLQQQMPNDNLDVQPWQVVEEAFYKAMAADMEGNWITQVVILFIVSLLILITVLMNTLERQHEFGVLLAVGTSPGFIFRGIVLEMTLLGFFSVLVGLLPAYALNWYFSQNGIVIEPAMEYGGMIFDQIRSEPTPGSLIIPAFAAVLTAFLVSLYPAFKAARSVPVEIMNRP